MIDAAGDRAELVRLILGQRLDELSLGDALQRVPDAGKGSGETAAVVPEAEPENADHRDEQHAGGERGLDGVVAGVGRQLGGRGGFRGDERRWLEPLNAIEPLRQLDHCRLRGAGTAPGRDLRDEADERDRDECRGEEAGDAGRRPHGPP